MHISHILFSSSLSTRHTGGSFFVGTGGLNHEPTAHSGEHNCGAVERDDLFALRWTAAPRPLTIWCLQRRPKRPCTEDDAASMAVTRAVHLRLLERQVAGPHCRRCGRGHRRGPAFNSRALVSFRRLKGPGSPPAVVRPMSAKGPPELGHRWERVHLRRR